MKYRGLFVTLSCSLIASQADAAPISTGNFNAANSGFFREEVFQDSPLITNDELRKLVGEPTLVSYHGRNVFATAVG